MTYTRTHDRQTRMTTSEILTVTGILVGALFTGGGIFVTVLLSVINRKNDTIEKLREANLNYRLALIQNAPVGEAASKLLQAIPLQTDGAGK